MAGAEGAQLEGTRVVGGEGASQATLAASLADDGPALPASLRTPCLARLRVAALLAAREPIAAACVVAVLSARWRLGKAQGCALASDPVKSYLHTQAKRSMHNMGEP